MQPGIDRMQASEDVEHREDPALSEASLAEDWNRPEEDDAWSHVEHRIDQQPIEGC